MDGRAALRQDHVRGEGAGDDDSLRALVPGSFGGVEPSSGAPRARDFSALVSGEPRGAGRVDDGLCGAGAAGPHADDVPGSQDAVRGVLRDAAASGVARAGRDASPDSGSEGGNDVGGGGDGYGIPKSHELRLSGHDRAVSAVALDDAGARLLSGGHDYRLSMYDFGGMKSDARPFRTLEPEEGHPLLALSWAPGGEAFLAVSGGARPRVYDREGKEAGQFVRGDPYIRDMKNTKGHVGGCTCGQWHPTDK